MVTYEMADSGCKTIKQYLSNFPSLLSFIGSKIESILFPTNSNFICNELHFEYSRESIRLALSGLELILPTFIIVNRV